MAKPALRYVCQSCGASYGRWQGRCEACGGWNTLSQEARTATLPGQKTSVSAKREARRGIELVTLQGSDTPPPRMVAGLNELDRVTGGGFVPGSVLLLGGDPGIGKSTLLLQTAALMSAKDYKVVYVSGEEAIDQVRLRANRLNLAHHNIALGADTQVEDILATLQRETGVRLLIIDSIQTMWTENVDAAPGTVSQVRASAQILIRYAKQHDVTVVLVGHVTKDGQIAGPRVVEHMVDAVLQFEGEGGHRFRLLRALKNRFGPTDEVGVFEMTGAGLAQVENPSSLFLDNREQNCPGAAVFAGMEGTRPVLVEMQALVAPTPFGNPRRTVVGWDTNRLAQLIAVLDARCGVRLGQYDVYLNVAGGLRVLEPAADLAVAAALVSSLSGVPTPHQAVFFGEVALSGSIRPVGQAQTRLREAQKLGFTSAFGPKTMTKDASNSALSLKALEHLGQMVKALGGKG